MITLLKTYLLQVLHTRTLLQSSMTTFATIVNGALGVLFYILVARILGPSHFGVFILSITVLTMTSDIASFGIDTGLIRFIGKYVNLDKPKVLQFLKLALEFKIIVWICFLLLAWWFMPFVANALFLKSELEYPLRLVLIGIGGSMLFSFVTSAIQAYQKYEVWSVLMVSVNFLRLVFLGILFYITSLSVIGSLAVYIVIPFLGFLIGMVFLPSFIKIKGESQVAKEFFHYNKWVALFIILAAVSSRLDIFLVGRLLTTSDAGIYGAANQLGAIVPQLIFAIAAVVAPKLASFTSHKEAIVYLKKLQLFVILISLVGLLAIPVSVILIPILFGSSYIGSTNIFIILLLSQLIFLISLPAHQAVFYYFSKPQLFVFIAFINLLVMGLLGWFMVTTFGLLGIAGTVLIGNLVSFLIPGIWVLYKFRK